MTLRPFKFLLIDCVVLVVAIILAALSRNGFDVGLLNPFGILELIPVVLFAQIDGGIVFGIYSRRILNGSKEEVFGVLKTSAIVFLIMVATVYYILPGRAIPLVSTFIATTIATTLMLVWRWMYYLFRTQAPMASVYSYLDIERVKELGSTQTNALEPDYFEFNLSEILTSEGDQIAREDLPLKVCGSLNQLISALEVSLRAYIEQSEWVELPVSFKKFQRLSLTLGKRTIKLPLSEFIFPTNSLSGIFGREMGHYSTRVQAVDLLNPPNETLVFTNSGLLAAAFVYFIGLDVASNFVFVTVNKIDGVILSRYLEALGYEKKIQTILVSELPKIRANKANFKAQSAVALLSSIASSQSYNQRESENLKSDFAQLIEFANRSALSILFIEDPIKDTLARTFKTISEDTAMLQGKGYSQVVIKDTPRWMDPTCVSYSVSVLNNLQINLENPQKQVRTFSLLDYFSVIDFSQLAQGRNLVVEMPELVSAKWAALKFASLRTPPALVYEQGSGYIRVENRSAGKEFEKDSMKSILPRVLSQI